MSQNDINFSNTRINRISSELYPNNCFNHIIHSRGDFTKGLKLKIHLPLLKKGKNKASFVKLVPESSIKSVHTLQIGDMSKKTMICKKVKHDKKTFKQCKGMGQHVKQSIKQTN